MVDRVKGVEKVTDNPFLNLYNFDVEKRNGKTGKYYVDPSFWMPHNICLFFHFIFKSL